MTPFTLANDLNSHAGRVPHVAHKTLKVSIDGGEPCDCDCEIKNGTDGAVLVLTTRKAEKAGKTEKADGAVHQEDSAEVPKAEAGPVEEGGQRRPRR